MMLDTMGAYYGRLPSQLLQEANVIDVYVMLKAKAIKSGAKASDVEAKSLTTDQMLAMVKAVKEKK